MALASISATQVVQKCGKCGKEMFVEVSKIVLGVAIPSRTFPNTIRMPPCSCGAGESLFRTWDVTPKEARGSRHDLHRRGVNALAQLLRANGQVLPQVAAEVAAEESAPPDLGTIPCTIPPA